MMFGWLCDRGLAKALLAVEAGLTAVTMAATFRVAEVAVLGAAAVLEKAPALEEAVVLEMSTVLEKLAVLEKA
jgi:hypothetical protein